MDFTHPSIVPCIHILYSKQDQEAQSIFDAKFPIEKDSAGAKVRPGTCVCTYASVCAVSRHLLRHVLT